MSDNWNFYLHQLGEHIASTFLDLGIRKSAPDHTRPFLHEVQLPMQIPKDNGLSSSEEFAILSAIEDKLTGELERTKGATYVGRTTAAGVRHFYCYVPEPIAQISITETAEQFPEYRFECSSTHDPGWLHYLEVLYPSDEEFQTIKNQDVLELLRKNGDELSAERPVTHWSFFKVSKTVRDFFPMRLRWVFLFMTCMKIGLKSTLWLPAWNERTMSTMTPSILW